MNNCNIVQRTTEVQTTQNPSTEDGSVCKAHPEQKSYLQLIPIGRGNIRLFSNRMLLEMSTTLQGRSWDQEYLVNTKQTLWVCFVFLCVCVCPYVWGGTLFSCCVLLSCVDFHFLFLFFCCCSRQRDGMGELSCVSREIGKIFE